VKVKKVAMPEQNTFQPDQKLARSAYVSSFQQYQELYKESIESPEKFWGNIAKQFHWETPYDLSNFVNFNFDISKGPISIKWMEGASTNLCYNLLDRNIKNGHGDKIAFFWYVLVFNLSMVGKISVAWVGNVLSSISRQFYPRARIFQRCYASKGNEWRKKS
jgi:hypothetical protein